MASCMNKVALTVAVVFAFVFTGIASPARAASLPVSLTGWTDDIIAEKTAANPLAATSNDYTNGPSSFVYYETGAPTTAQGLPSSGSFVSSKDPSVTFQFQPYTSNNAVNSTTTLSLVTPAKYSSLAFLVSGSGSAWAPTLNFSDASSTVVPTFTNINWTISHANNALSNMGLANRTAAWNVGYSAALYMYENDYTLSALDQAKTLTSITFTPVTGNQIFFALSGNAILPVPEPSTLLLFGFGAIGLVRRRNRA